MTRTARCCRSMGMLMIAFLVAAGCASGGRNRPDGASLATSSSSAPSPSAQSTTTSSATSPAFERRNAPPSGIARQVAFYVGAGDADPACYGPAMPARPFPYLALADDQGQYTGPSPSSRTTIEVFWGAELCLVGFVPNKRVALRITAPDGDVERKSVIDKEHFDAATDTYYYHSNYFFSRRPKDPVGIYDVVATQGRLRASLKIELIPSPEPLMYYSITNGEIEVSGLKAGRPLALNFYGGLDMASLPPAPSTSNPMDYLLPYLGTMQVTLDVNGQGTFPWPASLRTGCFGVDFKGYGRSRPVQCQ